jgi:hypothetical protein
MSDPVRVLDWQRLIESPLATHELHLVLRRLRTKRQAGRITGDEPQRQEDENGNSKQQRYQQHQPSEDIANHRLAWRPSFSICAVFGQEV